MNIIHYVRKLHPSEGGTFTLATTLNKYLLKNKHKSMVVSGHDILIKNIYKSDLIHFHGIWNIYSSIFITLCKIFKKPYVISTHGMLNSWSLKKNRLIKNIYFKLIEKDNLEKADYVHFLNSEEIKDSKVFNLRVKSFLVPNAIDDDHLKNNLPINNDSIKTQNPKYNPHNTKFQDAPCHNPDRINTNHRLKYKRILEFTLFPPKGMYK